MISIKLNYRPNTVTIHFFNHINNLIKQIQFKFKNHLSKHLLLYAMLAFYTYFPSTCLRIKKDKTLLFAQKPKSRYLL